MFSRLARCDDNSFSATNLGLKALLRPETYAYFLSSYLFFAVITFHIHAQCAEFTDAETSDSSSTRTSGRPGGMASKQRAQRAGGREIDGAFISRMRGERPSAGLWRVRSCHGIGVRATAMGMLGKYP
ncbi:hypothetical protein F5Y19DRAFT_471625 [Xylariaceae sp. FL1651]|nr:hypothetical protein F5Y19DRAFT_471625 [Xylariaceae sp. FL1651]